MKKKIKALLIIPLFLMVILSSCQNKNDSIIQQNPSSDDLSTTLPFSSTTVSNSSKSTENFKYNPPKEVINTRFISDTIIHEIKYLYHHNDEKLSYALPKYIIYDIKNYFKTVANNVDKSIVWFGVDMFDLNSDGNDDYIVEVQIMSNSYISHNPGDLTYEAVNRIYFSQNSEELKSVNFPSTNPKYDGMPKYIISDKTNDLNDFLIPVSPQYSHTYYTNQNGYICGNEIGVTYDYEYLDNSLIKITCVYEKSGYLAMKLLSKESDVAEKILYASDSKGTPLLHTTGEAVFYATLKDSASHNPNDFWIGPVEIQNIPIK